MSLAPLVSALRYRFYLHDTHADRVVGLERPAATIEEAIRQIGADLKLSATPDAEARALTTRLNTQTRGALDAVTQRWEHELSLAISDLARKPDSAGADLELTTRIEAIDRSYRRQLPDPDNPDSWYDYFDAGIAHLQTLQAIQDDLGTKIEANLQRIPAPGRLKMLLGAVSLAAVIAGGIALYFVMNGGQPPLMSPPPPVAQADNKPRVVRTVPVAVTPEKPDNPDCRIMEVEIAAAGASLLDAPDNGRAILQLDGGARVTLRRVVANTTGVRMIEIETAANAKGYIAESEARLPLMNWNCAR